MQELNWNNDSKQNLEFPVHYWNYIEKMYSQFSTGEHIVTKAYDDDNDYLGFTDDYDFCWGPVNEGETVVGEYNHNNGRLWGVYTKTAGEIYLLKANEDLTDWDRNELITFAPSGSRRASIEFNSKGHYEIAVEFIPAGSETYEIWLLSYPYTGAAIRQIALGTNPQLFIDHLNKFYIFYSDNDELNIKYRCDEDNYSTEFNLDFIFEPERNLYLRKVLKTIKVIGESTEKITEILFYKRDDDYQPYKYISSDFIKSTDRFFIEQHLSEITWEDIRMLLNLYTYDTSDSLGLKSKVTFKPNQDNPETITYTDVNGEGTIKILPYSTVYDVLVEYGGFTLNLGILVTENAELEANIDIPLYGDDNEIKDEKDLNIENELTFIEWVLAEYNLYTTVYNPSGNTQSDVEVLFKGQQEQGDFTAITDNSGYCQIDVLPYPTPYDVVLSHNTLGTTNLGILADGYDDTFDMTIKLYLIDDLVDNLNSINNDLNLIEWEDTLYTLNINLNDMSGSPISGAEITILEQQDQETITKTTDINGEATIKLIPYSAIYDIEIDNSIYAEDSIGILVDNEPSQIMDINLQMFSGSNSISDNVNNLENNLQSILWVEV